MPFLKRTRAPDPSPPPTPLHPEAPGQQYAVKINLLARSSDPVRLRGTHANRAIPAIVERLSTEPIEVIEPLAPELNDAAPMLERVEDLELWLRARRNATPISRHALYVLESVDALDMTVDTFTCGLLSGATGPDGYPDYHAIVGGVATRWDEATGELLCRALVGWGGRGVRGDTDRQAQTIVNRIHAELSAARRSAGDADDSSASRPIDRSGLTCPHCGFEAATTHAFFCTRCGMRMSRGA